MAKKRSVRTSRAGSRIKFRPKSGGGLDPVWEVPQLVLAVEPLPAYLSGSPPMSVHAGHIVVFDQERQAASLDLASGEVDWRLNHRSKGMQHPPEIGLVSADGSRMLLVDMPIANGSPQLMVGSRTGNIPAVSRSLIGRFCSMPSFSPSGERIACASGGGTEAADARVKLWILDSATLEESCLIDEPVSTVNQLLFTPDGTKLGVLTGPDFRMYDVATGLRLDRFAIPEDTGTCFTFNDTGTKVYLGTLAGKVHLVDLILVRPEATTTESAQQ